MFPAKRPRPLAAALLAGLLLAGMLPAVALADGPVATDDGLSALEDGGPTSLDVLANDTGDTTLTITDANAPGPQHGTTSTDGATITYTPDPDFNGVDTFGYVIADADLVTASATVTVTVTSVNDAPSGTNATVVATEDTVYPFAAADFGLTDPHDSPPNVLGSVVVASLPSLGALTLDGSPVQAADEIAVADIDSGKLQFKPALNGNGTGYASFTFQVRDDGGTADGGADLDLSPKTITIDVTPANDAPLAADDTLTVGHNAAATGVDVLANDSDVDGDVPTIIGTTDGSHGTVAITGGGTGLTYDPSGGTSTTDSFTYTIVDGHGGTATATVSVTITNAAPVANADVKTVAEDDGATPVNVLANDSDADGDAPSIIAKTNGSKGAVAITGGGTGLTYQPDLNANGSDSFTYTISDGHGGSDTATVGVTITPVNDNPVAGADSFTIGQNSPATAVPVLGNDSDPDGDARTIIGKSNGSHGVVAITGSGTGLTYQPTAGYLGPDSFTYTISDGHGGTAIGLVTVTVVVNHSPHAGNDATLTVPESAGARSLAVLSNDSDPDGDTLTITAKTNGAHGTVAITGGGTGLTYDPVQLYVGTDVFTYTISDGRGASATGTVLVTVVKDTTKPTVTAPAEAFYAQTVGSTTTRAHISWSGADAGTGIAKYQLQVSVNGGAYSTIALASATSTSINRTLTNSRTYRFRVRATDKQRNVSSYVTGPAFKPATFENSNTALVYSGSWTTSTTSKALGGSHRYASSTSARVSVTRAFRDVGIVATKSAGSGSAQVWIDGILVSTINLHASTTIYRQLVFHRHYSTLVSHTVEIRPIGGGRVYLDAFLLYR